MVLVAALIYWMIRAYKRDFAVFICLALFVVSYLPVSGIISLNAAVAEHWLYLPSAFLFLAGAIAIVDLVGKLKLGSLVGHVLLALLVIWLIFLGARTFIRTFDWKDQRTFLERTLAHGGDSARMLINLASLEFNEGKLEDAALHLHAALEKEPNQPFAIINLAAVALKQNDFKLARDAARPGHKNAGRGTASARASGRAGKQGNRPREFAAIAARDTKRHTQLGDRKTLHQIAR